MKTPSNAARKLADVRPVPDPAPPPPPADPAEVERLIAIVTDEHAHFGERLDASVVLARLGVEWDVPQETPAPEPAPRLNLVGGGDPAATASPEAAAVPTRNVPAEMALIAGMVRAGINDDVETIRSLLAIAPRETYAGVAQRLIVGFIAELVEAGARVDRIHLNDRLERSPAAAGLNAFRVLDDAMGSEGSPSPDQLRSYARMVVSAAVTRGVKLVARKIEQRAASRASSPEQILDEAERLLDDVREIARGTAEAEEREDLAPIPGWPAPPEEAAWRGPAGELALMLAPQTEADPVGILIQILVAFGNLIGRSAYWEVGKTRHHCNLYVALIGRSARARKGTAWDLSRWLLSTCDESWRKNGVKKGLDSGPGLIRCVRDPMIVRQKVGRTPLLGGSDFEDVVADPGVDDKRALFVETEFGAMLASMNRENNNLDGVLRDSFDSGDLGSVVKGNPMTATGAHVSLIGHCTFGELGLKLQSDHITNGLANRFLWACVRRSRLLPNGGDFSGLKFAPLQARIARAFHAAFGAPYKVSRDEDAQALWDEVYADLTRERDGAYGEVTARAEVLSMRLANTYATLDRSKVIRRPHLESALALWRYCDRSAEFIFGKGDAGLEPDDRLILAAIRKAPEEGLSKTDIRRKALKNHPEATGRMAAALTRLVRRGKVEERPPTVPCPAGGVPARRWFPVL